MSNQERDMIYINIRIDQISTLLKYNRMNREALMQELVELVLKQKKISEREWFEEMGL